MAFKRNSKKRKSMERWIRLCCEIDTTKERRPFIDNLNKKFKKVSIAKNNQDVINKSNWIFLSVTPKVGDKIIKDLKFKDGLSSMISIKKGEVMAHKISPSILSLGNDGELGVKVINNGNKVLFKKVNIVEDTSDYMVVTGLDMTEQLIIVGQQYVSNGEEVDF